MKTALSFLGIVIIILAVATGAYYAGAMQLLANANIPVLSSLGTSASFQGQRAREAFDPNQLSQEQIEQFQQMRGERGTGMAQAGAFGGGATFGTIQSIKDGVITVQTQDATAEVTVTDTTLIEKTTAVDAGDLQVGEQVAVSGSEAEDGRITARSIRVMDAPVRPEAGE